MNRLASAQPLSINSGRGNIELNIEELVIRGASPGDRQRLSKEIEQELARLLQEVGMSSAVGQRPGATTKSRNTKDDSVARQIAWQIYQRLGTSG